MLFSLRKGILAILVVCSLTLAARAESPWHFTVTADPRLHHTEFGNTLADINSRLGGPGAFHVSVGDIEPARYALDLVEF